MKSKCKTELTDGHWVLATLFKVYRPKLTWLTSFACGLVAPNRKAWQNINGTLSIFVYFGIFRRKIQKKTKMCIFFGDALTAVTERKKSWHIFLSYCFIESLERNFLYLHVKMWIWIVYQRIPKKGVFLCPFIRAGQKKSLNEHFSSKSCVTQRDY